MALPELVWIMCYCAVAAASICLVRRFGPMSVSTGYVVEQCYDTENGRDNVIYRVTAPALCCGFLVFIVMLVCLRFSIEPPEFSYVPTVIYWVILFAIKWKDNTLSGKLAPIMGEMLTSIVLAKLFDSYIYMAFLSQGPSVFDSSSIAFQMELAAFYVITGVIATGFIKAEHRVHGPESSKTPGKCSIVTDRFSYSNYYDAAVDVSEAKLFSYEREYGKYLPARFDKDILLRSLFFSIMAIEDSNRPKGMRFFERLLSAVGISKTTGVMQQKSDGPLSDIESVKLAIPFVEKMWDSYLVSYARSVECGYKPSVFCFSRSYYEYSYPELSDSICLHFSALYGDYCGTRMLKANYVYRSVLMFQEAQRYGMRPKSVSYDGDLFPREASWFSGEPVYWNDTDSVACCSKKTGGGVHVIRREGRAAVDSIDCETDLLRSSGLSVLEVKWKGTSVAQITCLGDLRQIEKALCPGWKVCAS